MIFVNAHNIKSTFCDFCLIGKGHTKRDIYTLPCKLHFTTTSINKIKLCVLNIDKRDAKL